MFSSIYSRWWKVAGVVGLLVLSTAPVTNALSPFSGGNNLIGAGAGLDENFISTGVAPGFGGLNYVTPNGINGGGPVIAAGTSMPGMTESIRYGEVGGGAGYQALTDAALGINIPQPMFLPASDARVGIPNPLALGAPIWGARTGSVLRWDVLDSDPPGAPGAPDFLIPAGSVTGQAVNLTPQVVTALSGPLSDDGLAPGSMAADGIPDFLAFTTTFTGQRIASFELSFFDESDGALFGGVLPPALQPRVRLYEGGSLLSIASPPMDEAFFDHDTGNDLTGAGAGPGGPGAASGVATGDAIDAAVDGTLLLGGRLINAFASLTWSEIDALPGTPGFQLSGRFELDIQFFANVRYDEGSMFLAGLTSDEGTVNADWDNVPFGSFALVAPAPGAGFAGGDDINGLGIYDFKESPSASQTFSSIIPEPVSAGLGLIGLGLLSGYIRRRKA